jgi:hypothetical protein
MMLAHLGLVVDGQDDLIHACLLQGLQQQQCRRAASVA